MEVFVSMKSKALLTLAALALTSASAATAQQTAPAPPAPAAPPAATQAPEAPAAFATTFFDDGNYLGIHVEEVTRENASDYNLTGEPRGVGVRSVVKGSPAERAGLREKDVILRFDGEAVTSVRKLTRLIEEAAPDHTARLTVLRRGSEQEVSATLASRERFAPAIAGDVMPGFDVEGLRRLGEEWKGRSKDWQLKGDEMQKKFEELQREHPGGVLAFGGARRIGVTTSPLGKQLAEYFGVEHGVLVNSVESGGPAEKAGLRAGDVITEAEGQRVEDAGDLTGVLNRKDEGDVTLTVVREHKQRSVRVTPEKRRSQGYILAPGSLNIEAPVAEFALPRIVAAPRVVVVPPHAVMAPNLAPAPHVRVTTPRIRVFGPGDRVL